MAALSLTLTDQQVATIYRRFYWDAVHGAELPDCVDYAVFELAVNSEPGRALLVLQAREMPARP